MDIKEFIALNIKSLTLNNESRHLSIREQGYYNRAKSKKRPCNDNSIPSHILPTDTGKESPSRASYKIGCHINRVNTI